MKGLYFSIFFYKKVRFHIGCLFIRKQLLEDNNLFLMKIYD